MTLKEAVKKYRNEVKDVDGRVVFYKEARSWCVKIFYCNELSMYDYYTALDDICKIDSSAIMFSTQHIGELCNEQCIKILCELVDYYYTNGKSLVVNELGFLERYICSTI